MPTDTVWKVVAGVPQHDQWIVALASRELHNGVRHASPSGTVTPPAGVVSSVERCRLALKHGWSHSEGLVGLAVRHQSSKVLAWAKAKGCRHKTADAFVYC